MIDPSPLPSRLLHVFSHVARWSLGLVLAFWLLLATAWGTLHGFIVPRITEWRAEIEGLATQALGAPVRIDAISAQSDGIFPTIHLSGVSILDAQGRPALQLQSVIATVSARSLLRRGLEQLYIDAPTLDIRRLRNGHWQVAGIDLMQGSSSDSSALAWLLELPELVIRQGHVHFTDELRAPDAVQLRDVDIVLRNRHWSHVLRIDATPAAGDSERIQLIGAFRQPLLPSSLAPWERWSGQWYASLQLQQVPTLPWPQAWGIQTLDGMGHVRAWLDVEDGQPIGITTDLALGHARVDWLDPDIPPLELQQLQGRLEGRWQPHSWSVQAQDLGFRAANGRLWPRSSWSVSAVGSVSAPDSTQLELQQADLSVASDVVQSLPVPTFIREAAARWQPHGTLHKLQLKWLASGTYQVNGQVAALALQPQTAAEGPGIPGFEGLDTAFEFSNTGGKAALGMRDGVLHFPGVFEEPAIPFQQLQAQLQWQIQGDHVKVEVPKASFANADAQGVMQGFWHTGDTASERFPGYLQLNGLLARANGARVYRYLPLEIPEMARHYVRDSIRQGEGRQVEFEVKGLLRDMPFDQPGTGRFYIKAPVSHVVYDFAPATLVDTGTAPAWPMLTDLSGTLVFEGASMQVQQASTGFAGHQGLRMETVSAHIPDLQHPRLTVKAAGHPDLGAALQFVRHSPLTALTEHALDAAQAKGSVQLAFDLELPIEQLEHSKVRGHVGFAHNALQFRPEAPLVQQLQGSVQFHEQGFSLHEVKGQTLGGSFRMHGGMPDLQAGVQLKAEGVATAEGLQNDRAVPLVAQIARHASGQSRYQLDITADAQGQRIAVHSDLQGMALKLPAPLQKDSDETLDLRVTQTLSPAHMHSLQVDVAGRGEVRYTLDTSSATSQVVNGYIAVGQVPPAPPKQDSVLADIRLPELDLDAWQQVLQTEPATGHADSRTPADVQMWLPRQLHIDVGRLILRGRELQDVHAELTHAEQRWRGKLSGKHFAGTVEYREPDAEDTAGHLFARFSRLAIPQSEASQLDTLAQTTAEAEPESLPALDIEVEQLEIAGKQLGTLQLKARNHAGPFGRDWTLEQFDLNTPEALWRAHGMWGIASQQAAPTTQLGFMLELHNAGQLLERFDTPGVVRNGQGRLNGQISWQGSPLTPQWDSMDGNVHMQVDKGQFLKVEPGMGKLLSVLSLQSLSRRITLDFRDVFSQGFAFDYVRGDVHIADGVARTSNLEMTGLNAAVFMAGTASLVDETQNLQVVVVPEINAMTASLAATAINPVVGVGSFLAQMFLRGPLMEAATRTFQVTGTWAEPVVEPVRNQAAAPTLPAKE